jgi:hypothetical protein
MSADEEKPKISNDVVVVHHGDEKAGTNEIRRADDILLARLGYKSEFRREFSVSLTLLVRRGCLILRHGTAYRDGGICLLHNGHHCLSIRDILVSARIR